MRPRRRLSDLQRLRQERYAEVTTGIAAPSRQIAIAVYSRHAETIWEREQRAAKGEKLA